LKTNSVDLPATISKGKALTKHLFVCYTPLQCS
jgi:hypothetical protein